MYIFGAFWNECGYQLHDRGNWFIAYESKVKYYKWQSMSYMYKSQSCVASDVLQVMSHASQVSHESQIVSQESQVMSIMSNVRHESHSMSCKS